MLGFGKGKTQSSLFVSEKEMKEFKKNMSRSELKEFEKRQKQARDDREWDALMMAEIFSDDL